MHHLHEKTAAGPMVQQRWRPGSGGAVPRQGTWLVCARLQVHLQHTGRKGGTHSLNHKADTAEESPSDTARDVAR